MKTILLYGLLISLTSCGHNVSYAPKSTQNTNGDKKKLNASQAQGALPQGIEILDRQDSPKKIVFGCGKKGHTGKQKHDHANAITVDLDEYMEPDIVADIRNTALWQKLQNNYYEKITLEEASVNPYILTPSSICNIGQKLEDGGILEVVGLLNYLLDDNGKPKKILFWEKNNYQVAYPASYYFEIEKPISWSDYQSDIDKGAPYDILATKFYVEMLYQKGSALKMFDNKDDVIRAGKDKEYEKVMRPFRIANEKYFGTNRITRILKKSIDYFNKKAIKEASKKLEKESLNFLELYFKKFGFQYKEKKKDMYGRDSLIFIKQ